MGMGAVGEGFTELLEGWIGMRKTRERWVVAQA